MHRPARPTAAEVLFNGTVQFGTDLALDVIRDLAPHIFAADFDSQVFGQK